MANAIIWSVCIGFVFGVISTSLSAVVTRGWSIIIAALLNFVAQGIALAIFV